MKFNGILTIIAALSVIMTVALNFVPNNVPAISVTPVCTVVLDAGHGEPDGGAVGVNGTLEKDINLSIAIKIREILESRGVRVIMTRTDDNSISDPDALTLHEKKVSDMHNREEIINNSDADLFLSVHMNSFTSPSSSASIILYIVFLPFLHL